MKTIQIRIKKGNADTTISIKESILNLYSKTFYDKEYKDNKRVINKSIRTWIKPRKKDLSQAVTKLIISMIDKRIEELKEENKQNER